MANFRNGNLVQGQTLGSSSTTVMLSSNNQTVSPGSNQVIFLQSDSSSADSRRFNIQSSTISGQQISIVFESDYPLACELLYTPGVGNVRITSLWSPAQYDCITLAWDGQLWVEVSRSNVSTSTDVQQVTLTLSQSQVLSLDIAPVQVLPPLPNAQSYIIKSVELYVLQNAAGWSSPGFIYFYYVANNNYIICFNGSNLQGPIGHYVYGEPSSYQADTTGNQSGVDIYVVNGSAVSVASSLPITGGAPDKEFSIKITYSVIPYLGN